MNYPPGFKEQLCESPRLLMTHSGAELSVTLLVEGKGLTITRRTVRA